jgi:hypothetical protein
MNEARRKNGHPSRKPLENPRTRRRFSCSHLTRRSQASDRNAGFAADSVYGQATTALVAAVTRFDFRLQSIHIDDLALKNRRFP